MRQTIDGLRPSMQADPARFLAMVAGWNVLFFGVLRAPWVVQHAALPLTLLQETIATWYGGRSSVPVVVTLECGATDLMALCAGVILAYPAKWRQRLQGVALVLPILFLLNVVRIGTLMHAAESRSLFRFLHIYAWPAVLMLVAAGLVFAWMRRIGTSTRLGGRYVARTLYCLGAFALAAPLAESSGFVASACRFVAWSATTTMHAFGAQAAVSGSVLHTARGSFIVTPECLISPIIPLWVLAVLWWPLARWQRAIGLVLTLPVVAFLATARLLVLAVPPAWVDVPIFIVHGFNQLVLFAGLVVTTAMHGAASIGSRRRAVTRGAMAVLMAGLGALTLGTIYNQAIVALAGRLRVLVPHTLLTLMPPTDVQGALALLPPYQVALCGAMLWAFGRSVRRLDVVLALAALMASQVGLLAVLGELAAHAGTHPHALAIRGWAVVWPVVIALVVLKRAGAFDGQGGNVRTYRRFWEHVGTDFPDLTGAASTTYYFENEKRLIARHLGDLRGKRVLKTDLWDEAKNTRILRWMQEQGATVFGVDISRPIVELASAEFRGTGLAAASGDVRALPFADSSFDAVYSMGTVEHFDETDVALRECYRVLKPGGRAIVGVPNRHDPFLRPLLVALLFRLGMYGYGFEKSYSRKTLRRLVEQAGFTVRDVDAILFIPGWLRMLDLVGHTRWRPLSRLTALGVHLFVWVDRHVPAVRKHGYLVAAIGDRPTAEVAPAGRAHAHSADGSEWIVDARGCNPLALRSRATLEALFAEIIDTAGLRPVAPAQWLVFDGEAGVTGLQMLSESHLACHTYPEACYAAFSLYSCRPDGVNCDWRSRLSAVLGASHVTVRVVRRGPGGSASDDVTVDDPA